MVKVLVLALLAGCVAADIADIDDAPGAAEAWRPDVDDGFGYACVIDFTHVITPCEGTDGHPGTCRAGTCRRTCEENGWADPTLPSLCPAGQHAELGVGGWDDPHSCVCIPNHHPWQSENTVPVPLEVGTGREL